MRLVAVEEHVSFADALTTLPRQRVIEAGFPAMPKTLERSDLLAETDEKRLSIMDEAGVAIQVLSVGPPDSGLLRGYDAVGFASICNTGLASIVTRHPGRFRAFAHLPMVAPNAAADMLESTVVEHGFVGALINGQPLGRFLDDPFFAPVLARAEKLGVPIYLHPNIPSAAVREAYYEGLSKDFGMMLASAAWGWHYEVCVHVLRLVVSGTLETYPKLKIVVGHMGEGLPAMLERCELLSGPAMREQGWRTPAETLRSQLWISTSGFHDRASFLATQEAFGIERLLYSADYPFNHEHANAFFEAAHLSSYDAERIAFRNATDLLQLD